MCAGCRMLKDERVKDDKVLRSIFDLEDVADKLG